MADSTSFFLSYSLFNSSSQSAVNVTNSTALLGNVNFVENTNAQLGYGTAIWLNKSTLIGDTILLESNLGFNPAVFALDSIMNITHVISNTTRLAFTNSHSFFSSSTFANVSTGYTMSLVNSSVDIMNCQFRTNRVHRVIYAARLSSLNIYGSNFQNNMAGVIESGNALVTIFNSTFLDNNNGAILATNTTLAIDGCKFENNRGAHQGGAISATGPDGNLSISNTNITNNAAITGGGLYISTIGSCTITKSSFTFNFADEFRGYGAGICLVNVNDAKIEDTIFSGNNATYEGGGIHSTSTASLRLNNITCINNTASLTGGCIHSFNSTSIHLSILLID